MMKRSTIAVLVAACMGVGAALVAFVAFSASTDGCTAEDDRLIASLGKLDILDAHPAHAKPQGGRGSGCDSVYRTVTVSQAYRPSGQVAEMLSFYQDAATVDGWKPSPKDEGGVVNCFVKSVDGRDVHLSVLFLETEDDDYEVNVSSSVSGRSRC